MQKGCQALPWLRTGEAISQTLATIKHAGYEGVELGHRFMRQTPPQLLHEMLSQEQLKLAAMHWSPPWHQMTDQDTREAIEDVLRYVRPIGAIILTSSTNTPELLEDGSLNTAKGVNRQLRLAQDLANDAGTTLLFHNHAWEFAIPKLFDTLTAEISLAVDVAHLERGTGQAQHLLHEWHERIRYLHLRDIENGHWTPALGLGNLPICHWIQELQDQVLWAVVEMEPDPKFPDISATWTHSLQHYAHQSWEYLRGCLSNS